MAEARDKLKARFGKEGVSRCAALRRAAHPTIPRAPLRPPAALHRRLSFAPRAYPQARTGGKGTVRRKAAAVTKATATDDKRLGGVLKRLQVNAIPGIEEVSIIKDDGSAVVFANPKVQANIGSNTCVFLSAVSVACVAAARRRPLPPLPARPPARPLRRYVVSGTAENRSPEDMAISTGMGAGGISPAQLKALQEALKAVRVCGHFLSLFPSLELFLVARFPFLARSFFYR